jgi:putative PIG3 family NAD(P)H quinone oxidoreductase
MARMKAVVVTGPGGPDVLELRDVPRPVPGPEELLVRVQASGVNRADLLQRTGRYPAPPGWPADIPGLEFAGAVEDAGPACRSFAAGDWVMGIVGGGGYAEYLTLHERCAVRVPEGLAPEPAGAVPEVFMTAYDAVSLQMGLTAGETLLVHAVGSGVGTAAIQLARAAGARVIGTSRTPEKLERAAVLGLDVGVLVEDGWPERVRDATGGRGVDVILDLVGAPHFAGNMEALAVTGRWIVVGVTGGSTAEVDLRRVMGKRASLTGTVLRARPLEDRIVLARAFEDRIVPLFERGILEPVVDRVYAPGHAAEAHRRMEENLNFGKLVLAWGDGG